MRNLIVALGGVIFLGGEAAMAKSATCTMASFTRTVELRYETPGDAVPCEVRYAKPTEGVGEQVLWRAEREAGYCEARFGEFVDKLRGLGWTCNATEDAADDWTDDVGEPEPDEAPEAVADEPEATDTDAGEASAPTEPDSSDPPTTE